MPAWEVFLGALAVRLVQSGRILEGPRVALVCQKEGA